MEKFLVVLVIVLAVALIAVLRSRARVKPPAPSALEDEPPFRIVTLGTRGSGKTMFLASMFHELQATHGRGYQITAPFEQGILLNAWFRQVSDTSQDWPRGTAVGEKRTFRFSVMAQTKSGRERCVLRFDYLEYAGGLLTDVQDAGSTGQSELLAEVAEAQALICLLDGAQIRRMLDGDQDGARAVSSSIRAIKNFIQGADCPVTFVVTKWDLLRDEDEDDDERLTRIAKQLRYEPVFDDLVRQHTSRIVRLVPVSAVGDDFAEYHAGRVTKRQGGSLSPTNVDVPIAAVVPDIFEQFEMQIEERQWRSEFDRLTKLTRLGPAAAAGELSTVLSRVVVGAWSSVGSRALAFLSDAGGELFREHGEDARSRDQDAIDAHLTAAEREFREFRSARRRVLRELRRRVDVLEGRLPGSRLRGD